MDLDHLKSLSTQELANLAGYTLRNRPLNTVEAAEMRGLKRNTLEIERHEGNGPPYLQEYKHGAVRYVERDLLLWVLAGRRRHTGQRHDHNARAAMFATA